jgi:serpin B
LFLVNAVWFKGLWALPFDRKLTMNVPFHVNSEKTVSALTMHVTEHFGYGQNGDVQVLELPYLSNQVSMVIFLPRKSDGLPEFERTFTASGIRHLQEMVATKVAVSLPRFTATSGFDLIKPLQTIGILDAFSPSASDFSGITTEKPFFVEAALHKAYVDVNEEGTQAAAPTLLSFTNGGFLFFNADHPFLFMIRHNPTGAILFIGRVVNPLEQR